MRISVDRKTSILLAVMFLQLLFLTVYKDNSIFNDIEAYLSGFDFSLTIGWGDVPLIARYDTGINFELGWCYYTKLVSFLVSQRVALIFTTGFFIILSYFIFIRRYSHIPWLSVFLFITLPFYNSLFVLRQNIAVAICLFAIPYIIERKIWKFLLLILIAFAIHQTAIILILVYVLYTEKIDDKSLILFAIMGIILFLGFQPIINFAASYFVGYKVYTVASSSGTNATPLYISLAVLVFVWIIYRPLSKISNIERLLFIMILLSGMVDLSRIGYSGTTGRVNTYFFPAIMILLPNAIKKINSPVMRYIAMTSIFSLYFLLMLNQMNYGFKLNI